VLSLVLMLKALVEFAGLLLVGQGLVYILSFGKHEGNAIYRFMRFLTSPVVRVSRMLAPQFIVDKHVPALAFFLLFMIWVGLIIFKFSLLLEAQQ